MPLVPFPELGTSTLAPPTTPSLPPPKTTRPRLEIWGCDLYSRETFSLFVDDVCAEFDDAMTVSRYTLAELEADASAQAVIDARLGAGAAARALAHLRGA